MSVATITDPRVKNFGWNRELLEPAEQLLLAEMRAVMPPHKELDVSTLSSADAYILGGNNNQQHDPATAEMRAYLAQTPLPRVRARPILL